MKVDIWRLGALALLVGLSGWHAYDVAAPGLLDRTGRLKGADFLQFYTYGALVGSGHTERLYDAAAHAQVARDRVAPGLELSNFRPNYPPVIAWLASPLARLPFLPALAIFSAASAATYLAALGLLWRHTLRGKLTAFIVVVCALAWPTMFAVVRYGQLSALSLAIVVAAVVLHKRSQPFASGLTLGLLAYKPHLLVVPLAVFAVTRQWRLLVGVSVTVGLEWIVDLMLVGPAVLRQYVGVLLDIAKHPELVQFFPTESHSVRGFVMLLVPVPPVATVAGWLSLVVCTALAAHVWRVVQDWRPRWAALIVATLLASPHLLTYDLLVLAVPLVLILDWWLELTGGVPRGEWRWALFLLYFGAWPGTFIARLYHVQISTVGMVLLLCLLVRALREDPA
jgi:Glycosyltransferase family 87